VFLHGLGKSLPKGDVILVPHRCDALIGEPLRYKGNSDTFKETLESRMLGLANEGGFPPWE
jgi:hypothetical protein